MVNPDSETAGAKLILKVDREIKDWKFDDPSGLVSITLEGDEGILSPGYIKAKAILQVGKSRSQVGPNNGEVRLTIGDDTARSIRYSYYREESKNP